MTRWVPATRSATLLAAMTAADDDRTRRPERYRLDVETVAEAAARRTDPSQFVVGWRDGLEQYLGSAAEDGRLTAFGTRSVISTAIGRLRSGAAMAALESTATTTSTLSAPPIVITGGWRTGTTFLYRLLASDQRLRAPLPVELADPARLAVVDDVHRERIIEASGAAHDVLHALSPELRSIHDSGARLPEECGLAMGTDLRNWAFTSTTRLDSYARWLAGQDLAPSYRAYRTVLEALDRGDGRRWVLKAPPHLAELRHVAGAFPGATIVVLHRDIVETIASGASLFAVFRSLYSAEVDAADVGRFQRDQTEVWMRRLAEFRTDPSAATVNVVDVDYAELVADPAAVIQRILAVSDLEPIADTARFIDRYNERNPRHAHGTHRYDAAAFGLDEQQIREQFADLVGAHTR